MINHLRHMAVFARVVDEGSFRAAAQDLALAPSRVSEIVSDLEEFLGATLLYRSTRKIALTNEGRIFYARVVEMLRSAESGLNELNALSLEPVGALRIGLPAFMATSKVSNAMGEFVQRHPLVALSVDYSDRQIGFMDGGYDLKIRVGWLDDGSVMSRKLSDEGRKIVAGAGYAASRSRPVHPSDLEDWDWIRYTQRHDAVEVFSKSGDSHKIIGNSQLEVDNVEAMYNFTRQNLGVTVLPNHLAERGLLDGSFVELIPDWSPSPLGYYAVWPDKSRRENLTQLFVRFIAEQLN